MSNNVEQVARYIIGDDEEHDISHLKLQKLLYYCQGFHLAILDKPLFEDKVEHWHHGPVVPSVYQIYKSYESKPLPTQDVSNIVISSESKDIIDEVLEVYDQFSAWKLRDLTHMEDPWKNTKDCEEITHEMLKIFFKTKLI